MLQLYEFNYRFNRLFLLTLQSIDTLRLYEFTILRLYHLLLSTLSTKNIYLPIYGFAVVSFAFTSPLRIYRSTASRLHAFTAFSCLCFTHRTRIYTSTVLLRFPALAHAFHDFLPLQCASVGSSFQLSTFSTVDATATP